MINLSEYRNRRATDPVELFKRELIDMIKTRNNATPRHLQRELGPSQVAHPCMRKLAYGIMDAPKCNPDYDPLPSIIGTATHKWLESAIEHANTLLGRERWISEKRVEVATGLSGSCDLYDCDTATVIDWKVPGESRLKKYRKDPGPVYRTQVHMYGRGYINAGLPVEKVGILFIPRGGTLNNSHLWMEKYDPAIADGAVARRNTVIELLDQFQTEHKPETYTWFPKSGPDCTFCSWFSPDPTSPLMCSGEEKNTTQHNTERIRI